MNHSSQRTNSPFVVGHGETELVVPWLQVSSRMAEGQCQEAPWTTTVNCILTSARGAAACWWPIQFDWSLNSSCGVLRMPHGTSFYIPVLDGLSEELGCDKWALEFSSAFSDGFMFRLSPTPGGWWFSDCVRCFSPCPPVSVCVRNWHSHVWCPPMCSFCWPPPPSLHLSKHIEIQVNLNVIL